MGNSFLSLLTLEFLLSAAPVAIQLESDTFDDAGKFASLFA